MNTQLFDYILEQRKGQYWHCIEVSNTFEIESILESITSEYENNFSMKAIKDFCCSLDIYSLDDNNEKEIYEFSIRDWFIENCYQYGRLYGILNKQGYKYKTTTGGGL